MKKFLRLVLISFILFAAPFARAQDAPPSEASIRELMQLMDWRTGREVAFQNMESSLQSQLRQMAKMGAMNERQERRIPEITAEAMAIYKEEITLEKLEPIYIDIYRKTLTQKEIDGIIAFYKSDAGKAYVAKFPMLSRQINDALTERQNAAMPKMVELIDRFRDER